jgi:hypothetical protein
MKKRMEGDIFMRKSKQEKKDNNYNQSNSKAKKK